MKKKKLIQKPTEADDYLLYLIDREVSFLRHGPLYIPKKNVEINSHDKEIVRFVFSLIKDKCYRKEKDEEIENCLLNYEEILDTY